MDIDGKKIANEFVQQVKEEARRLGITPGLAFVLVGKNPASGTYVRMKEKACKEVSFYSKKIELEEGVSQVELLRLIDKLNDDETIHGILVQMPLPSHLSQATVLARVSHEKDVDGFHPYNVGKYVCGDRSGPIPCTPLGILKILEKCQVETNGADVVVLGRSNIVGRPIANLLSQKQTPGNATVTLAHTKTNHLHEVCKRADILIVAVGKSRFVQANMVKKGAVVIDVGINHIDGRGERKEIVGDVDYNSVAPIASLITPVPGGVGPMTIAMLLHNTLECAKKALI